jgi:hypothetical protein
MKNKIGFNLVFAVIAFPIGLAIYKDTDFSSWTFRKPVLDSFYLVVFILLIFFMLKKKNKDKDIN